MLFQVLVTDPKELEAIRQRESDITKERIQKILNAGGQRACSLVGFLRVLWCARVARLLCACVADITKERI
jgi:hypothetical protein